MKNSLKLAAIPVILFGLSGCLSDGSYSDSSSFHYGNSFLYPEGYESYRSSEQYNYQNDTSAKKPVVVPDSYHVGSYRSPPSSKHIDNRWVNSQNPGSYTIELANSNKPNQVAKVMQQAPKGERMAEIKYRCGGDACYKALYGSYGSYDEAQKALSALPNDVQQSAGIKTWGSVQNSES